MFKKRLDKDTTKTEMQELRDEVRKLASRAEKALTTLEGTLDGFDARLTGLADKVETVDYEWTDWFDKFRRLHARLAKREARSRDEENDEGSEGPTPSGVADPNGSVTNPMALRLLGGLQK